MPTIVINRRRLHRRRMPHGALLIFFNPGRHRALNFRDQRTFNSLIIGDIARLMARIKILRCPRLKVRRVTITAAIKGRGSETCASSYAATITIPPPRIRSLSPGQITSYKLIFTGYVNSRETGPLINSAISIFRRVASSRPLSDYNEILERLLRKFFFSSSSWVPITLQFIPRLPVPWQTKFGKGTDILSEYLINEANVYIDIN